jgi:hypothetical protein
MNHYIVLYEIFTQTLGHQCYEIPDACLRARLFRVQDAPCLFSQEAGRHIGFISYILYFKEPLTIVFPRAV